MSGVGTAESIARMLGQFFVYSREIAVWQHAVAVEYDDILALGVFHTVIARRPGATVLFCEILYVEPVYVFFCHLLARDGRTVLHDDNLKVGDALPREAVKEFVSLFGAVVYRYDYRIFHWALNVCLQLQRQLWFLFEIECEHYHLALCAIDRLGEDELSLVCDVASVLVDDVRQSIHEFHLRYEFEERRVEVASQSEFEITVSVSQQVLLLFFDGEVKGRRDTSHDVWPVVVEPLSSVFDVNRHGDICRLDGLVLYVGIEVVETWLIVGRFCIPFIAACIFISVLYQFDVLQMHASEKPVMKLALVYIWAIHHFSCLRLRSVAEREECQ